MGLQVCRSHNILNVDLGLQIDLLEADRLERLGQVGYDRANILDVLGSGAYYLAGSEYEKSSFRGLDSVDETGELLLIVLRALQLGFDLGQIECSASLVDATTFTIFIVVFICTITPNPSL